MLADLQNEYSILVHGTAPLTLEIEYLNDLGRAVPCQ